MALRSPSIFLKGFQTSIPLVKIIHLKISSIMKKNSTHKKLFQMLVLGDFAHQLASQIYPYEENRNVINYQAMDEVTDPGTDFDPSDITTKCRHDAILSFFPEYGRTARPLDKNLGESWFTHVSIEFKNSLSDLLKNGSRMVQYLGATDYFFLGVPKNLLPDAVQLLQRKPLSDHADQIGLVDLTKGQIVIMPCRQKEKDKLRQALICQRIYEQHKRYCNPDALYTVRATLTDPKDRLRLQEIGPFAVNKRYGSLVQSNLYE